MKSIFPIILFAIFLVACHKKMLEKPTPQPSQVELPPPVSRAEIDTFDETQRHLVASLRRTPCFGKCPSFEVKIWSDGSAEYDGRSNAPRLGHFRATVKKNWLASFLEKTESFGFFSLENYYPTSHQKISDLPSTFTFVRATDGRVKKVENLYDAPLTLRAFERFFEEEIEALNWKPTTDK